MGNYRLRNLGLIVVLSSLVLFAFNNCADNFKVMTGDALIEHQNSIVSKAVYINAAPDNVFYSGKDLTFTSEFEGLGTVSQYNWTYMMNGAPQGCNQIATADPSTYKINCPVGVGSLVIKLMVIGSNGMMPAEDAAYVLVANPAVPVNTDVAFMIPLGTGSKPWNTADNPIRAKMGQKIIITNGDTVIHRMHTGGKPCPHGANIAPGASMTCLVNSPFLGNNYDHNLGTASKVFFETTAN